MYVFMDESGDLGFNKRGSSRYFIVTFLILEDKKRGEKIVTKVFRSLKKRYKVLGALHAAQEEDATNLRVLKMLSDSDHVKVFTIILNKEKISPSVRRERHKLYNDLVRDLLDYVLPLAEGGRIELIASQRETNKRLNENFINGLTEHNVKVYIKKPFEEKCLQLVDAVSWSMMRKWEYGDDKFYYIIEDLIEAEQEFTP